MNVIPGMQAAFVDIGQKKNAFLYIDDLLHPHLEKQPKQKPPISDLLKPGQELILQVVKEAIGNKGARVTTHYSLPGRWLVYMPSAGYVAVSKKIGQEEERSRLREIGEELRTPEEGLILRTVAEYAEKEAVAEDLAQLREQWGTILLKGEQASAPAALHHDLSMVQRLMRDVYSPATDELIMDCPEQAGEATAFWRQCCKVNNRMSEFTRPIFLYLITTESSSNWIRIFSAKCGCPEAGIWFGTRRKL